MFSVHPCDGSRSSHTWQAYNRYISILEQLLHRKLRCQDWATGQRMFFYRPAGWAITPDTHGQAELLNALISFPSPQNASEQGTFFYRPRGTRPRYNGVFRSGEVEAAASSHTHRIRWWRGSMRLRRFTEVWRSRAEFHAGICTSRR
jgi:hypothetical protein